MPIYLKICLTSKERFNCVGDQLKVLNLFYNLMDGGQRI